MKGKSKDDFQVECSFQGVVKNIRIFSVLGKNIVQKFWPGDRNLAFDVELFLTEALSNAFIHAHDRNPGEKLGYKIGCKKGKLRISVFDCGKGFSLEHEIQRNNLDPLVHHGRGLRIIQALADHLQYDRGTQRNQLVFEKDVSTEFVERPQ